MRKPPYLNVTPRQSRGLWLALLLTLSGCATMQGGRPTGAKSAEDLPQSVAAPAVASASSPTPPAAESVRDPSRSHVGTGNFVNQKPATPPLPSGPEEFALNFEDSDIRQIVQYILGDYLKESFTIHPSTSGKATIRTSKPVSKQELLPLLEGMLRDVGQVMVKEGGMYKIRPAALGVRGSVAPTLGGDGKALPNGYSPVIVQLKYVGVADMARLLLPYQVDPAAVQADPVRNLLIITGTQRELKHLQDIIELFDVDFLRGYSFELFPMSTDVKSLVGDLDRIFGAGTASPLAGVVKYIPIERMNALLIVTTQPRYLEEAKKWIDRLDKSGGGAGGLRLNVYPVQHGKAEKLAALLNEVYGNKQGASTAPALAPGQRPVQITTTPTPTAPGSPVAPQTPLQSALQSLTSFASSGVSVSKDAKIVPDADNNALLILASPSDFETIQTALRQLDVARRQVSVEVLVAEVTMDDSLKFGIEWFVNARNNTVGAMRSDPSLLPRLPGFAAAADPRSVVNPSGGLQLINLGPGGDLRAVLQALGTEGRSKVLSTPRLWVLDNEKAMINVGDQISVDTGSSTGTTTGGNVVTTRQYLSTGVILNLTARINAGGRVTMEINQEVSNPTSDGTNPNIATRKVTTVVTVSSGETVPLAGLIRETDVTAANGLPLLSKIPLIGAMFGSQSLTKKRTELVMLITPTVVTNSDDARIMMNEVRSKLPTLEKFLPPATK